MAAITVPGCIDPIPLLKCTNEPNAAVPTVDLSAPGAAAAVADACRDLGCFRATNHGFPSDLADALESHAASFFALPQEDKMAWPLAYDTKTIGSNGDVGWLEYVFFSVASGTTSLPQPLRAALEEYTVAAREVGGRVLELVAEGLGLEDRGALRRMVADAAGTTDELVRVNHYPACPLASGVTGFGEHTDPQIISLLRSNRAGGLHIMLRDGRWVPVASDPDSLLVIVGDLLQVLTNGRFKSVKHRVVAPEAGEQSRLSVVYFGGPAAKQRIAPLPGLMEKGEKSLYRKFTWGEYLQAAFKTRLGDHHLGAFELRPAKSPSVPTTTAAARPSSHPQKRRKRRQADATNLN